MVQVAGMGEVRNLHTVVVGKPKGNKPRGRPARRYENNIKMDVKGCEHVDLVRLSREGPSGGLL